MLPAEVVRSFRKPPYRAQFGNYRLFYIPEKVLSINKNCSESNFYDLSQYFPGDPEPASLEDLQEKADLLGDALRELGISRPASLASPAACFRGHPLLKELSGAPTIYDAPEEHWDMHAIALETTPREWISNYQIGHFPELFKYDLASAYPFLASRLPDLRDCSVFRATGTDILADYGFFVGDFTVYPDHPLAPFSPFLVDRGDGALVNFVGRQRNYPCTLDDVRTLYQYRMGEFHFKRGWCINENTGSDTRRPFQRPMGELYDLRGVSSLKSYIIKRVMNGIIGRLLETRRNSEGCVIEYGDNFNPVYHALITNPVRLQVFEFIVRYGLSPCELVHVGVDGIRATRQLFTDAGPVSMGAWRFAGKESAFVLSPGAILSPERNFKRTGYYDLLDECKRRPRARRMGLDGRDPIDVDRLFITQIRGFERMPERAGDLLGLPFTSMAPLVES